ncbi:hypothetical protein K431DRAFT_301849 [Polychaeton citri CBS 116435]|uniref:Uncharacterized protein n=1 Tax=Polychaeton citri CBS 116435 TaxID=1314669 RepID=A0A9P4UPA5_9PEZI|nr:hypothetical protein K431DRAFT_301849 [Polychaeton citri CBS 116435]
MPAIEDLELRWYNTRVQKVEEAGSQNYRFFDTCHRSTASTTLRTCTLRCIHISKTALLDFLKQSFVRKITLQYVRLYDGTWRSIFDTLKRSEDAVTCSHLDDLFEHEVKWQLIFYEVPGKPKFPYTRGTPGPSDIVRKGEEVQQKLEYGFGRGRPMGSPETNRWRRRTLALYGALF